MASCDQVRVVPLTSIIGGRKMAKNLPTRGCKAALASQSLSLSKVRKVAPMLLVTSLCLLSACSSRSDGADPASEMGGRSVKVKVNPGNGNGGGGASATTSPSTPTATTVTYDLSVGGAVDARGFAVLPLRSGAHHYFVSSASGSDGNGCGASQQPGTPLRSIAAAVACVQAGSGDQVLVAEGTKYSEGLPNLDHAAGFSAQYPTVIQSYDPADPLNADKYGHAANGRRPVVNTGANEQAITCCTVTPANYLAIRGFDINPGNVPDMMLSFTNSNGITNNYILIENNIFRYTMLAIQEIKGTGIVIRKNAIYGTWSKAAHAQGIYLDGIASFTAEDNVFWHTGWKIGASRDDDPSVGGPTMFRHSIYQQTDADGTVRRNIFIDPSATGCSCRGNTTISENVFIDNPIAIIAGEGTNYNVAQPNGVSIEVGYNAILGDADINSISPRGGGIETGNGKQGSAVHHNLIARSRNPNAVNVYAFITKAGYDMPSYAYIHDNVEYQWAASGKVSLKDGSFLAQDLATYDKNAWSDPASGTNMNIASHSTPNPYTQAQLFAALGCIDKATCSAKMIETPELGWAATARALLWQGYGL